MYKKILSILFVVSFFIVGCKNTNEEDNIKVGVIGNDYGVNRAFVSKMMSFVGYNKSDIVSLDNVINFEDVKDNSWDKKYINCAYIKGDMSGVLENEFAPDENLTITQTQYLINKYDKSKKIKIDDKNKDKPISYALWCDIYMKMINDNNIKNDEVIILATNKNNKDLKEGYVLTDKGLFCFDGIDVNKYLNMKIKVIKKDKDVIAVTEVLDVNPTLKRVYIENFNDKYVDIFIGGGRKRLLLDKDVVVRDKEVLADIKISGEKATNIEYYVETIRGNINKIDDKIIRINNKNYILDDNFTVYDNTNSIVYSDEKSLIIGEDIANYFVKGNENKIYGAIIDEKPKYETVRVNITNGDKNYFDEVQIEALNGIKVLVKGNEKSVKSLNIRNGNDFNIGENEIILLSSIDKNAGISLKSNNENLKLLGKIEIQKVQNKYIVVNIVDLETYVEGVLANGHFNYTNKEMLKTLAVIYRTTAIYYINENLFTNIGANLDNKKVQKYIGKAENESIKRAVLETKGKVMFNLNNAIKPTYFSYGGGATANSNETWIDKNYNEYPKENKEYLTHIKDYTEPIYNELQEEVNSNIFYKTKDIDSIEKNSNWFRWTTTINANELNNSIKNILNLYKSEKYLIKTFKNNEYVYDVISDIGKIKDVNVIKRGEAGNVMELEVIGEKEKILLISDNIIKNLFDISYIINNNGDKVENIKKLPSSNYVFDKTYDSNGYLKEITFYGGGYGHNVGLSLYGANEMSKNNNSYDDILQKYYTNIEIKSIK